VSFKKKRIPPHLVLRENYWDKPRPPRRWWLWLIIILLFASSLFFAVSAAAVEKDQVESGELLFRQSDGSFKPAVHIESKLDVAINGMIAHVTLQQAFTNDTDNWQEAVYVYPLPDTAAVNYMQMVIGERIIRSEVREKRVARQIYEQAMNEGKKAAITEQSPSNLFTQSVANIAPFETIEVEIRYVQTILYNRGEFSMRFPMTLTPRYMPGQKLSAANPQMIPVQQGSTINPISNPISIRISLNTGLSLNDITSLYHDIDIQKAGNYHQITLRDQRVPMDRDFVMNWQPTVGSEPRATIFRERIGLDDYLLLMLLPPDESTNPPSLPREMIFIIDTSGSMQGPSIEQAKQSLQQTLTYLRPQDSFNVIEFNDSPTLLFTASQPADPYRIQKAGDWVSALTAGGGTEMSRALYAAMTATGSDAHLKHIVFITDGAVANETALLQLISGYLGDARLFTVGIGSAPNSYFMRRAAEFGAGTYTHIGDLSEVAQQMETLYRKLDNPVARNIQLNWPQAVESYPANIPSLYLHEPLLIVARADNLQGMVEVTADTANNSWYESLSLEVDKSHLGVGTLWAHKKIETLEDIKREDARTGRPTVDVERVIIDVALTHNLVTPYTSLVAVEEWTSRMPHDFTSSTQVSNLVASGQQLASVLYPNTATPAGLMFWIGAIALLIALVLVNCSRRRACQHYPYR